MYIYDNYELLKGWESDCGRWQYTGAFSSGSTLEELEENAVVSVEDWHGNDAGTVELETLQAGIQSLVLEDMRQWFEFTVGANSGAPADIAVEAGANTGVATKEN